MKRRRTSSKGSARTSGQCASPAPASLRTSTSASAPLVRALPLVCLRTRTSHAMCMGGSLHATVREAVHLIVPQAHVRAFWQCPRVCVWHHVLAGSVAVQGVAVQQDLEPTCMWAHRAQACGCSGRCRRCCRARRHSRPPRRRPCRALGRRRQPAARPQQRTLGWPTRVQATQAVMRPARVPRPARDQSRPPTLSLAAASARPGARHGAARLAGRWRARCDGRDWRVST